MNLKYITAIGKLLILIFLLSCNESLPDSRAIATENKKRKIGRIKPMEIVEESERLGKKILTSTDSIWQNNIEKEILQNIDSAHSKGCRIFDSPYKDVALSEISVTKWGRTNIKSPMLLTKEKELFDAYEYSHGRQSNTSANVQKSGDTLFIYSTPLTFNSSECIRCHSSNKVGQFAGMLSSRISKKKVIENIWLNK